MKIRNKYVKSCVWQMLGRVCVCYEFWTVWSHHVQIEATGGGQRLTLWQMAGCKSHRFQYDWLLSRHLLYAECIWNYPQQYMCFLYNSLHANTHIYLFIGGKSYRSLLALIFILNSTLSFKLISVQKLIQVFIVLNSAHILMHYDAILTCTTIFIWIKNKCPHACDYSCITSWFEKCDVWYSVMHRWQELQTQPEIVCFHFICISKQHRQNLSCLAYTWRFYMKHFCLCFWKQDDKVL